MVGTCGNAELAAGPQVPSERRDRVKGQQRVAVVLLLLAQVMGCGRAAPSSEQAMFAAAKSNNTQEVERLLAGGADMNGRGDQDLTPLAWAAAWGSKETAELLIARGADINAKSKDGFTALHTAAYNGHKDIVELLVRKGALVDAQDIGGRTPLHKAMEKLAIRLPTQEPTPSEVSTTVSIVKLLLANNADVNARQSLGEMPIHYAAASGQPVLVELLIGKGADVNAKGPDEATPL